MILASPKNLKFQPQKIISLVPSQTELLYALGLEAQILGITKFCVHPEEWRTQKIIVGGTKNLRIHSIEELNPDLIIANKEENNKADIEELAKQFNVWVTDVHNIDEAMNMIADIGTLTHKKEPAIRLIEKIHAEIKKLTRIVENFPRKKILYLIWQEPFMTIGSDSFIHDMMQIAGFDNVFADRKRYPSITEQEILNRNPEYIFLSTEPYPFKAQHKKEFEIKFPGAKIMIVDGEMCSWYGSRMEHAFGYLAAVTQKIQDESVKG